MKSHLNSYLDVGKIMKITLTQLLAIILFTTLVQARDIKAQAIMNKTVSLNLARTSLGNVLTEIEKQTDVKFVYSKEFIQVNKIVSINSANRTLDKVLDEILKPLNITYEVINGQIALRRKRFNRASLEVSEAIETRQPELSAFTVTGKVTSSKGEALPGVTVVLKGAALGTTTDVNGNYSLALADGNGTLVFSFIGYLQKEVAVNNNPIINVTLTEDAKALEEVVVIGYGERQRKDVMGAVSSVDAKAIEKSPFQSPELAMQGRMTGVFVSTPGGNPNARPTVRIRGVSTFNNAEPLYVVDGIPIYEYGNGTESGLVGDIRGNVNVLNTINPNDIESISVLKDASAAAIYGNRASNGVILITTKRGKSGKPRVEINASRGVQNIPKTFDVLTVPDYVKLYQEMYQNNPDQLKNLPVEFQPTDPNYLGNLPTVDWQKPLLNENARIEDYSARIQGGSDATTYYFSGGYNFTQSPLVSNHAERYSLAASVDSKVSKYIQTGIVYRLSYTQALDNTTADLGYAAGTSPWQPIYDPNGPYGFAQSYAFEFEPNKDYDPSKISPGASQNVKSSTPLWGKETNSNIFGRQAMTDTRYGITRNMGTAYFQVQPLPGLKFKGTVGMDWIYNLRTSWTDRDEYLFSQTPNNPYTFGVGGLSKGSYGERYSRTFNINKEFSVNYSKALGEHNIDVLVNASEQTFKYDFAFASSSENPSRDPNFRGVRNVAPFQGASSFFDRGALIGYLGRISYNYASKYYLDLVARRDGSFRFAPGYKWGTFPSVSAAWRISSESFMQGLPAVNDLRIRAGWGRLGNQETSSFAYLSRVNGAPDYAFGSGGINNAIGVLSSGAFLGDFPVFDLTWETAETSNIALEGAFLNNKITATIEYYNKVVSNILQSAPLAASVGNANNPTLNIATVRNSGAELALGYNGQVGQFRYNVNGNFTSVKNRVVKTFKNQPQRGSFDRLEVGQPIGYIWGYKVGGIFQNQAEIDAWKEANNDQTNGNNFKPGDIYFQDVNRNAKPGEQPTAGADSLVNAADRTFLGKTIPGYYYGLNLGANFKNFDLSVLFQGIGDVQKYNFVRAGGEQMNSNGVNQWTSTLDRWTPENPSTTMPRAVAGDPAGNNRISDRFVEDAGFLRLRNIQLGYSLPASLRDRLGFVSNFRIYAAGINVFTATKWTGLDPENDIIPPTRSFSLGINATF